MASNPKKIVATFWERWSAEYLTTLQARQKWTAETDSLKIGDIVIVKEDNMPPLSWALARVTALHPGAGNVPRVATIRIRNKDMRRPVIKLFKQPAD